MAIVILLAILATRHIELRPRGWQNLMEMAIDGLMELIESNMGKKGRQVAPIIITLFLFLLVSNELGLIPGFTSPTNDINTTLGLALMIVMIVHVLGIKNKGMGRYVKHFFEPFIPFVIINIVEEVAKPITLSFRLFGNILAGEILLIVLGMLVPYFVPTLWLGVSVFIGIIQAFIFTILSISYFSSALQDNH